MNRHIVFFFAFISFIPIAKSQEKLSLQQAIEIALKNNYSILIAKNQSEIAKNDHSAGNAGFLPQVSLGASGNLANNNTQQHYSSGLDINKKGVGSDVVNTGIALNWTLFDGMKMFATNSKLKELEEMGTINAKIQIENMVSKIIGSYYDIVRQKQLFVAIQKSLNICEERLALAETKSKIGSGSESEILQAKVDLNEQKSAQLKQKINISNSKTAINVYLAGETAREFDVVDSIPISYHPKLEELKTTVFKQNNSLLFAQKNVSVANYALKEIGAQRYPMLSVNANYNFARSENQAGFILLNQNTGFNAGFTASWLLFNGMNVSRQIKNAQITALNYELHFKEIKNEVEAGLLIAYTNFQNSLEVLDLEEENAVLAGKNVTIAMERFRLGYITSLQLKDAQKSFLDAQTRLVSARYEAKISETELMRLNGALVKYTGS